MKKILLLLLAFLMISTSFVFAQDDNKEFSYGYIDEENINPDSFIVDLDLQYGGESLYPESYDLRDYGLVTSVKNQNPYGTCWTFATMASIESNLLKTTGNEYDLSELQLAYFAYRRNGISDPLGLIKNDYDGAYTSDILKNGGNAYKTTFMLASGIGAIYESRLPYSQAGDFVNNPDSSLCYTSDFFLDDSNWISMSQKEVVKKLLVENGAISTSYYDDNSYMNYDTNSYYCNNGTSTNHAITIVGWDDNYPASNFNISPQGNGAWLCKNSWGDWFGDKGYFYISYYDTTLSNSAAFSFEASEGKDYDIYQYDGNGSISWQGMSGDYVFVANVYTAQDNLEINKIGFVAGEPNSDYYIRVYLNPVNKPDNGTELIYKNVYETYAGFHTVDLDQPVTVSKGERFSVEVGQRQLEEYANVYTSTTYAYDYDYTQPGQSYFYNNHGYTIDLSNYQSTARIKVYTTSLDEENYQIGYELNGGKLEGGKTSYSSNDGDYTLPVPSRDGYEFDGWYENSDFSGEKVTVLAGGSSGDRKYYAKWNKIEYSIYYSVLDGKIENAKTSYYVDDPDYILPIPERTGFDFKGWYLNAGYEGEEVKVLPSGSTGNKCYYANWVPTEYSISFDLDGGYFVNPQPSSYNLFTRDIHIEEPLKEGYSFTGWSGTGIGSTTKNLIIYYGSIGDRFYKANWKADKYTYKVKHVSTTGLLLSETSISGSYGETLKASSLDIKGYGNAPSVDVIFGKDDDGVIELKYEPVEYNVLLNLNGGTADVSSYTYTIEDNDIVLIKPSKDGYVFDGWYDADNQKVDIINTDICENISLSARWSKIGGSLPGDMNCDGEVNGQDRILLRNYLTKKIDGKDIDLDAADVNKDGEINAQDRVYLRNKITGKI